MFEAMSGLKINFLKSEVMMVLEDSVKCEFYANMLNYQIESWSMKYLGVPVCGTRLRVVNLVPLTDKLGEKLDGWVGNNSCIGGRVILI